MREHQHPNIAPIVWGSCAIFVVIFMLIALVIAATVPASQDSYDLLKIIGLGVLTLVMLGIIVGASSIGMNSHKDAA